VWDLSSFKQIAFSALALKPPEFWALTPAEFEWLEYGYLWRREREREQMSGYVTNLICGLSMSSKHLNAERIYRAVHGRSLLENFDEPGALETHPDNESLKRDMAKRAREMYRKLPGREPGAREEIQ